MDSQHGRAEEAGEQMNSELDAIQERLRALKQRLDARQSVAELHAAEAAELAASGSESSD